jgi:hypothetical protein
MALDYEVSDYTIDEKKYEFPHFIVRSNLTYFEKENPEKLKTYNVEFVPELTLDYTLTVDRSITGDKPEEQWGIECKGTSENDCTPGKEETQSDVAYQGTEYSYFKDNTVMCFLDEFLVGQGTIGYNIRRVNKWKSETTGPWKSGKAGVLGLGPKSDLVDYIYKQYDVMNDQKYLTKEDYSFGFAIKLNSLNIDDRWTGLKAETFDGSFMTINGYKEASVNREDGVKWAKASNDRWALNSATVALQNAEDEKKTLDISKSTTCLDFNNPGMLMLPNNSPLRLKIDQFVYNILCPDLKGKQCDDTTDIKNGPVITVKILEDKPDGDLFTFTIQP